MFIKGLGVDRSTNDDQEDYIRVSKLEEQGLRQYIHKYDLGMEDYYFNQRFMSELQLLADEEWRVENPGKS